MNPTSSVLAVQYGPVDPGPVFDESDADGDVEMTTVDEEMHQMNDSTNSLTATDRLIIAFDFGTTFSSVAYTRIEKGMRPEDLQIDSIKCIENYSDYLPPPGMWESRQDVPTELWYDTNTQRTQDSQSLGSSQVEPDSSHSDDYDIHSDEASSMYDSMDEAGIDETEGEGQEDTKRESKAQYWGFGVQRQLKRMDIPMENARRISRFKLLLDQNIATKDVREGLAPILKSLRNKGIIRTDTDIFTDYFTHLLQHTKAELRKSGHLADDTPIEFVLCVPAKWSSKGCRVMQTSMRRAVEESGLGNEAENGVCNLFILSEPEAAAACVLAEHHNALLFDECVVILDAGGGTIDAVTYKCAAEAPLRLSAEIVEPDSKLCGASYINERFEKMLIEKLQNEEYLVKNGKTIKSIAEALTIAFENGEKRTVNVTRKHAVIEPLWVDDLLPTPGSGLFPNCLHISHEEIRNVFRESFQGAKKVLSGQLEMAIAKGHSVQTVILTGGFSQCRGLQMYLESYVKKETNLGGGRIQFIVPKSPSTAVAKGAVLRALNKENGPARITQCSYGILRTEPYEPLVWAAHRNSRCHIDESDGERYIDSTIYWLITKGQTLPSGTEISTPMKHTFSLDEEVFLCEEEVYLSDQKHESHYRRKHAKNKAAEWIGAVVADMTFLRTENLIQPERPSDSSTYSNSENLHWAVHYELVMIVDGRNLRYEVRWPALTEEQKAMGESQDTQAQGQICIAAAFQPGTK